LKNIFKKRLPKRHSKEEEMQHRSGGFVPRKLFTWGGATDQDGQIEKGDDLIPKQDKRKTTKTRPAVIKKRIRWGGPKAPLVKKTELPVYRHSVTGTGHKGGSSKKTPKREDTTEETGSKKKKKEVRQKSTSPVG